METAAKPRQKRWLKLLAALLIALVLFLLGLPIYFGAMQSLNSPTYIKKFTKQQALEDYDDMWRLLEIDFPALQEAASAANISLPAIKESYRSQIEALPEQEIFNSFYGILYHCIWDFGGKGNLKLLDSYHYKQILQALAAEPQNKETCDFAFHELWNPKVESTYRYFSYINFNTWTNEKAWQLLEPLVTWSSSKPEGENIQFSPPPSISKTEMHNNDVAYLGFINFFTRHKGPDKPVLESFFEKNRDKKYWIIDMRYCAGGDDRYWIDLLVAPNLKQDTKTPDKYTLFRDTPKTQELFAQYPSVFAQTRSSDLSPVLTLPAINKQSLATLKYLQRADGIQIKAINPSKAFQGKIILLIDHWNGSTCDSFAGFCKETGFATLVGKQTMGNSGGLNPIVHRLPNSGLALYYQMDYTLNPDGSLNSIMGTKPDIESPESEDVLKTALRAIEEGRI